jgi:catechol 2,3-dioxygenase-like lactoylglutathione lyase family enzyme
MGLFDGSVQLLSILILAALSPCECFLVARKSKGDVIVDTSPRRPRYSTLAHVRSPLGDYGPICASSSDLPLSQQPQLPPVYLQIHHTALKTRNITNAIAFYSLLGYQVASKFRAGPARAAFLELPQGNTAAVSAASVSRLELLEVPAYMLPSPGVRAPNLMDQPTALGYNHVALDVTFQIQQMQVMQQEHDEKELDSTTRNTTASTSSASTSTTSTSTTTSSTVNVSLADWMSRLNTTSVELFGKTLRVALEPQQQIIGRNVYELAFLFDADGCLVELLNLQSVLPLTVNVQSGWEPWDGTGFIGSAVDSSE